MRTKYIIRFLIAALILLVLFASVEQAELIQVLSNTDLFYFTILVMFSIVLIWVSCIKWQIFIEASGNKVNILKLMNFYTIGYFFNSFMPAYIGGDIARSLKLGAHTKGKLDAFIATFMERFTGLLAMVILGACFVATGSPTTKGIEFSILILAALVILFALLSFSSIGSNCLRSIGSRGAFLFAKEQGRDKYLKLFERVRHGILTLGTHPKLFITAMLYSFAFHALTVVNTYIACLAVGVNDVAWSGLFVVVPLVLIISMVPLTPSGLGIQEGAFLFLLQRIGMSAEEALAVGIILRIKVVIVAIVGGLLLFTSVKTSEESGVH